VQGVKQPVAAVLRRRARVGGLLLVALSTCSFAVWAQGVPQGTAAAPDKSKVAPPPADLEPGVNTSATQPSSAEPAAAPTAAPAPKSAQKSTKRATVSGSSTASGVAARAAGAPVPKPGAPGGKAHDSIELDTTQITGNRELPKVLYIVPWKRSDLGDLLGKPVNSLLDEVLTPVDRDVFKRQNRYYDALKPDAKDAAGAAESPK
jgi:hypothetical protein